MGDTSLSDHLHWITFRFVKAVSKLFPSGDRLIQV